MKVIKDEDITPQTVAKYFLTKSSLTPKKIQKLVYYAYAWFIALNNQDEDSLGNILFSEEPEAWLHGPVFPTLYQDYKSNGWHEVSRIPKPFGVSFANSDVVDILDQVWAEYGKYSADQLEFITHQESPWKNARKDTDESSSSRNKISKRDIFVYYNSLINENNTKD